MIEKANNNPNHWDAYWGGANADANDRQGSEAVTGDAPGDKFDAVWRAFLERQFAHRGNPTLADLACGAGVVLGRAVEIAAINKAEQKIICGVDYSIQAAAKIADRSRASVPATGIAASIDRLPFSDQEFDLVVSQFGVEYAGVDAFGEAARILAPGGAGRFVVHYKNGGIDGECRENFDVLDKILSSGLFDIARSAFKEGRQRQIDAEATKVFAALKPSLEGEALGARTLLARLMNDISRLLARRQGFHPKEALTWLEASQNNVRQYQARMRAMNEAAMSDDQLKTALALMADNGVSTEEPEALTIMGKSLPAAWLIKFHRNS